MYVCIYTYMYIVVYNCITVMSFVFGGASPPPPEPPPLTLAGAKLTPRRSVPSRPVRPSLGREGGFAPLPQPPHPRVHPGR